MPTVTDIKRQKRPGRFGVYVDGAYCFSLSDLDLSTSGLRVGDELTESAIDEFKGAQSLGNAYGKAIRYIGYRPRSRREVTDYLRRKEVAPDQIEAVLTKLEAAGLVNDADFAASWVASRQALKPRSKRVLMQELMQKGVSRDDIVESLSEIDPDSELETLVGVARRKSSLRQYQDEKKLIGYLGRQGYTYDLIKKALARLNEET
jgi:regulatory protein